MIRNLFIICCLFAFTTVSFGYGYFDEPVYPKSVYKNMKDVFSFSVVSSWYNPDAISGDDSLLDTEVLYGAALRYGIHRNMLFEIRYEQWDHNEHMIQNTDFLHFDVLADLDKTDNGDFSMAIRPITFSILYYFKAKHNKFLPYIGIGGGIYDCELRFSERKGTNGIGQISIDKQITGFNATLGGEYFTSDHFSVKAEVRYHDADENYPLTEGNFTKLENGSAAVTPANMFAAITEAQKLKKIDISGVSFGVGMNFYFR